jgi:hypothetical protein
MMNQKQCTATFDSAYIAWRNQKTANFRGDSFLSFYLFVKTQRQLLRALSSQGRDGFSCWHITFSSSLGLRSMETTQAYVFVSFFLPLVPSFLFPRKISFPSSLCFPCLLTFNLFYHSFSSFLQFFLFLNVNPLTVSSLKVFFYLVGWDLTP